MSEGSSGSEGAEAHRTIGEVAEGLGLPQHVLRFWETRFPQVRPLKRAGGRRYYRPDDVALLRAIKDLLYGEGYTIKGVQRLLRDQGTRAFAAEPPGEARASAGPPHPSEPRRGSGDPPPATRSLEPSLPGAGAADAASRLEAVASELAECAGLLSGARGVER